MTNDKRKEIKLYIRTVYRYIGAVFGIILLPFITFNLFATTASNTYEDDFRLITAYIAIIVLISYFYSTVRQTAVFNEPLMRSYFEADTKNSLLSNLGFILSSIEFWVKAAVLALFYALIPLKVSFTAYHFLYPAGDSALDKLKVLLILYAVLFVLDVAAHLSAIRYWNDFKNNMPKNNVKTYNSIIGTLNGLAFFSSAALTFIIPWLYTLKPIAKYVFTPKFFIIIAVLVAVVIAFPYVRAFFKRKSFIKRLRKTCKQNGYVINEGNMLLSIFNYGGGEHFTVTTTEGTYACKFITGTKRSVPIIFDGKGTAVFMHRITFMKVTFSQKMVMRNIAFESQHPKVLIVNPAPIAVLKFIDGVMTELDNADEVGGYKIFAGTGFVNTLERDLLHINAEE